MHLSEIEKQLTSVARQTACLTIMEFAAQTE